LTRKLMVFQAVFAAHPSYQRSAKFFQFVLDVFLHLRDLFISANQYLNRRTVLIQMFSLVRYFSIFPLLASTRRTQFCTIPITSAAPISGDRRFVLFLFRCIPWFYCGFMDWFVKNSLFMPRKKKYSYVVESLLVG
jgi:hypothetical protein